MMQQSIRYLLIILAIIFVLVWLPFLHSSQPFLSIIPIDYSQIEKYGVFFYKLRLINALFFIGYAFIFFIVKKASKFIKSTSMTTQDKSSLRVLILFMLVIYVYSVIVQVVAIKSILHNKQSLGFSALWLFYINALVLLAVICVLICMSVFPSEQQKFDVPHCFNIKDKIYNFNYIKVKLHEWCMRHRGKHNKSSNYGLSMLISSKAHDLLYSPQIINKIRTALEQEFNVVWCYEYQRKYLMFFLAYSPDNIRKDISKIYMSNAIRYFAINKIFSDFKRVNDVYLCCKIISYGLVNDNLNSICKILVQNQYNFAFERVSKFVRNYNEQINVSEKKNFVLLKSFLAEDSINLAFSTNYVDVTDEKGVHCGFHLDIEKFYEFYDTTKYENIFKRYLIYKAFEKLISTAIRNKLFFIDASSKMFYDSKKWKSGLKHTLNHFRKLNNTICVIFTESEYEIHFRIIKKIIIFQQYFPNLEICIAECTFSKWIINNIKHLNIKFVIPKIDLSYKEQNSEVLNYRMKFVKINMLKIAKKYCFNLINTKHVNPATKKRDWCILNTKKHNIIKKKEKDTI